MKRLIFLGIAILVATLNTNAQNTENINGITPVTNVNYSLGLGVGVINQYEGSDDYLALPYIIFSADWNNGRYVRLSGLGLDANLSKNRKWRFGPILRFKLNRNDNIVDNQVVADLESLGFAVSTGLMGRYDFGKGFDLKAEYAHDISGVSDGGLAALEIRYTKISKRFINRLVLGTSYGTERYLKTYFGVNASNIGSSTLSNYDLDEGFKDVTASISSTYMLNPHWFLSGQIGYSRLVGDVSDSPLVNQGSPNQILVGLAATYRF